MTKKSADHGAQSELLKSVFSKRAETWIEGWIATGTAGATAAKDPRYDADVVEQTVKSLIALPATDAEVAALLVKKGVDDQFDAALETTLKRFAAARKPLPPDLRHLESLTPEERAEVDETRELVSDLRDAAFDAARAGEQVDDLSILGRGTAIGKTLESTRDATRLFLTGAASRGPLLEEAGIGSEELDELQKRLDRLQEIEAAAGGRQAAASNNVLETLTLHLALESALLLFAARAKMALRGKAGLKKRTLEKLPRAPERRRAKETPASGAGTTAPEPSQPVTAPVSTAVVTAGADGAPAIVASR